MAFFYNIFICPSKINVRAHKPSATFFRESVAWEKSGSRLVLKNERWSRRNYRLDASLDRLLKSLGVLLGRWVGSWSVADGLGPSSLGCWQIFGDGQCRSVVAQRRESSCATNLTEKGARRWISMPRSTGNPFDLIWHGCMTRKLKVTGHLKCDIDLMT